MVTDNPDRLPINDLEALPGSLLGEGHRIGVSVTGTSMYPALRHGDRVGVAPCTSVPRKGTVICFKRDGRYILHRLVGILPGGMLQTAADFYREQDKPIASTEMLGMVYARWPGGCEGKPRRVARRSPFLIRILRPLFKILYRLKT